MVTHRSEDMVPMGFARGDMEGDDKWCALHDGTLEAWGVCGPLRKGPWQPAL